MKRVFLHGALGDKFGDEWELDIRAPMEVFGALSANNEEIAKYIFRKQKEGVNFGIKKSPDGDFIKSEEESIKTAEDFHIFAIPEGAGLLGSLIMLAVNTAASIYISKKLAEAMERDDSTVSLQTQSYVYNGQENRYQQGGAIPVGYGRLIVGSNIISNAVVNYDLNSENGRIINFNNGQYNVIPSYSKYFIDELGPLGSSYLLNAFDGASQFRSIDPSFALLTDQGSENFFGTRETLYGQYENEKTFRERAVSNADGGNCTKEGNMIGGYFKYCTNLFKSIDTTTIPNYNSNGNWWPDSMFQDGEYKIKEVDAVRSSLVCVQAAPTLENSPEFIEGNRMFYPTSFGDDGLDYLPAVTRNKNEDGVFPIQVGQRWRNGKKEDGVGWFRLESVSVQKNIDLIGEGPIEGFCDENGETLPFKKIIENPTAELVSSDGLTLRTKDDDYMRGVFLNNTPVKEVVNAGTVGAQDVYNLNEFDIDIGMNANAEIGAEDQTLMEPQYLFTANTKPFNQALFGPVKTEVSNIETADFEIAQFKPNTPYSRGSILEYQAPDSAYTYKVISNLNSPYEEGSEYDNGDYVYSSNSVTAFGASSSSSVYSFYKATNEFDKYKNFSGEYVQNIGPYEDGDKVKANAADGSKLYCEMEPGIAGFKGVYTSAGAYVNTDVVQGSAGGQGTPLYEITGGARGMALPERGKMLMTASDEVEPIEVFLETGWATKKDIYPESLSEFWEDVSILNPAEGGVKINGVVDEELRKSLFVPFSSSDGRLVSQANEQYYLSHTVINPLVEEVIVTLQVDELVFVYPGDEIDVEYRLGPFWSFFFLIYGIFSAAKAMNQGIMAKGLAGAAGGGSTVVGPGAPALGGGLATAASAAGGGSAVLSAVGSIVAAVVMAGLSLKWWRVGTKVENSGETWPNRARFRIKYGNEGSTMYTTDINIYGVATSTYQKDVKIFLPPNPSQKDRTIKVYKLNYERNPVKEGEMAARYKEKMSLAAVTEIVPTKLSYPNSVVIGTRVNAKDVPSVPDRTYNLKLKKVAIPSNYNPETRQYEGNWNGRFAGQQNTQDDPSKYWTDNPAWCLYDLISNQRFGVAKFGLMPENIDKWTLYKIAKYCDQKIPTGYSSKYPKRSFQILGGGSIQINEANYDAPKFRAEFGYIGKSLAVFYDDGTYDSIKIKSFNVGEKKITLEYAPKDVPGTCATSIDYPLLEPRYTFNGMLMSAQNAFKMINEFALIFRAYAYWAGGAINFFQDEKKDPVMLFSNNNISADGFSYSSTPRTSRTNSCKIKYNDRFNHFRTKMENSEDQPSIRDNNIIEQTIDGFGITSPGQAKRASEFIVKSANLETEIIAFNTNVVGSYLRPGDVVSVLDSKRTVGRFAGKVIDIKVSGDGRAAEIDVDFPVRTLTDPSSSKTWKKINLYNISGNQTIESLNEIAEAGTVSDTEIDNMRASQIGQYWVSEVTDNDTKIHLRNNPYSMVTGSYSWPQALRDAETRGGIVATIDNAVDQGLVGAILPNDATGWIGGFYRDNPQPDQFAWFQPQNCTSDEVTYFNWAEGFPKVGEPLETDSLEPIITDSQVGISTDSPGGFGAYLAVSGSNNSEKHGGWVTLSGVTKMGYVLEKKADDSLLSLTEIEGTTFSIDDSVNFAEPNTYKVINITEDSVGVFKIQGIEYNPDKFDNIEKESALKTPESPVIFTEQSVDAPPNVRLEISSQGGYGITVFWEKVAGAAAYKVQFFNGTALMSSFEVENDTGSEVEQSYSYKGEGIVEGGNYFARVYSLVR